MSSCQRLFMTAARCACCDRYRIYFFFWQPSTITLNDDKSIKFSVAYTRYVGDFFFCNYAAYNLLSYLTFYQMTKCWTCQNSKHLQMTNFVKMLTSFFSQVENIVAKGENAARIFLLFPQFFSKGIFPRVLKSLDCVVKK